MKEVQKLHLANALQNTIEHVDLRDLDDELHKYVSESCLQKLAKFHIRGEAFFPVPSIIVKNPFLLGYYRLLYGISQKAMYVKSVSKFKGLEGKGVINNKLSMDDISDLCSYLIKTGEILLANIDDVSPSVISDLQLLTLGPQLRGGKNNAIGDMAVKETFELIREIVKDYLIEVGNTKIVINNRADRKILIQFSSDPDISITETFDGEEEVEKLIAIEVKGGRDYSNIHNRIGEAEKSHQKAKKDGFNELWTIIRVEANIETLKVESPSTTKFYNLDCLLDLESSDYQSFKKKLYSSLSI